MLDCLKTISASPIASTTGIIRTTTSGRTRNIVRSVFSFSFTTPIAAIIPTRTTSCILFNRSKHFGSCSYFSFSSSWYPLKNTYNTNISISALTTTTTNPTTIKMAAPSNKKYVDARPDVEGLTKRRFFFRQASDIYGGAAGFFAYGPPGCAMKNNLFALWRQHFVVEEDLMEIEDTCIMQERVLKASGHVEKFSDFVVKDSLNPEKFWRADKLLEEEMEKRIAGTQDENLKKEYKVVINSADGFDAKGLVEVFEKYQIRAPESGNPLTEPVAFNLMFPTPIGPVGGEKGFLRPETAQGTFLNYKFCKEQNGERMPFGIAQIGKVFRNEIAPRAGLTRMREFQQAEIEWFIKPGAYDHPKYCEIKDLKICLFGEAVQLAGEEPKAVSIQEALDTGIIRDANQTMGYFIARTFLFLVKIGCNPEHIRFRQHLKTEMAHYACDCWDAETLTSYGWLEIVGIANRSCYDLNAHANATKQDLKVRETLQDPVEVDKTELTKESAKLIMQHLKKAGKPTKEALEAMDYESLRALQAKADAGEAVSVTVADETHEIPAEKFKTTTKKEKVTTISYTPGVIEPAFGIDRMMFSVFEHTYQERPADPNAAADAQKRAYLRLPANMAPYKYTILPVDNKVKRHDRFASVVKQLKKDFAVLNCAGTLDDTGATIGKRYARNDELGIPFAITIDLDTFELNAATVRERDSCGQIRVPLNDIPGLICKLFEGSLTFAQAQKSYSAVENQASQLVGIAVHREALSVSVKSDRSCCAGL
ncbi:unnamed protein product [Amoebophrya sp. A25]|nr:unnamed protein product [Amoebophrya sp. A25]|eukprot:GSA25T00005550001.1